VDHLLARGLTCLAVLDISGAALARAQRRLGPQRHLVRWIEADVTADWRVPPVDIWHDRAVFHFLTDERDRAAYLERLRENLKPSGSAVIATFALDGPTKCSGLPVARYSPDSLSAELGADFKLVDMQVEQHHTPAGAHQSFCYSRFRRSP
jgi:SAM-dependent methyltransferase